jgi:hypothetical protein
VDHEGYLEGGLCPGFCEGTCEALSLHRSGGMRALEKETDLIRRGDIERAILEWIQVCLACHPCDQVLGQIIEGLQRHMLLPVVQAAK